jgi:glycosyltransferase involved in cell wall biosynthesis
MTDTTAIITRTKNRPLLLKRCLLSVGRQTCTDYLHVIVNDGGEPSAVEATIDATLADRCKLQVIHNPQSLGLGGALNVGVRQSNSRYIVVLDDDDTFDNHYLEKMVGQLSRKVMPSIGAVVCRTSIVHERIEGGNVHTVKTEDFNADLTEMLLIKLAQKNLFNPNAFLYERHCFDKVALYREDLPALEDWDFNLRFLLAFDIDVLPEKLANWHWRMGPDSGQTITSGKNNHVLYTNHLRNQWLRDDIASGKVGLGFLNALVTTAGLLEEHVLTQTRVLSPLNRLAQTLRGKP